MASVSGSGSVDRPARSSAGPVSLLGPALQGGEHPHLGGLVGVVEVRGDAAEQDLAEDLTLIGLDPQVGEPVLGREERLRLRSGVSLAVGVGVGVDHAENDNARRPWGARGPSVRSVAPMVTVLMPLPACDFDPTEVAVSWQVLSAAGHDVVFATPSGWRAGPTTSW